MPLTHFISLPHVKSVFRETFIKPFFTIKRDIISPPKTKNYLLLGTAFDYLLRFFIKHINSNAITFKWISELALNEIKENHAYRYQFIKNLIENAKLKYNKFIRSGRISKSLLKSIIQISKIDDYYRTGGCIYNRIDTVNKNDVQDLKNLYNIINKEYFLSKKRCILIPTFGKG